MKKIILAASAFMISSGGLLSAAVLTFSGNTAGQPSYLRTTTAGSESSQSVPYAVYNVTVDQAGSYDFSTESTESVQFDTFISLYTPTFDAANSETNWQISNDDATANYLDGSAFSFSLNPGTNYAFVVTGFLGGASPDAGAFTATITGPGTASALAIPEPSSSLAGFLSAGIGFAFCSRRMAWKKRSSL